MFNGNPEKLCMLFHFAASKPVYRMKEALFPPPSCFLAPGPGKLDNALQHFVNLTTEIIFNLIK